jgi:hypothetical protein
MKKTEIIFHDDRKNRFDGYPGNKKMQEVIEKLLP